MKTETDTREQLLSLINKYGYLCADAAYHEAACGTHSDTYRRAELAVDEQWAKIRELVEELTS